MKYIVLEKYDMFIFPDTMSHKDMASKFPEMEVTSAGFVYNYADDFGKGVMDQVRFSGSSQTLGVRSDPGDLDLFRRQTAGL